MKAYPSQVLKKVTTCCFLYPNAPQYANMGHLVLRLHIGKNGSYSYTLGPEAGIVSMLGAPGYGFG